MRVTKNNLYRIILEEYIKEEGYNIDEGQAAQDLLRQILGDEKYCQQYPEQCQPPEDGRGGDTAVINKPEQTDQVSAITAIVKDMDPEDVAELFQAVFKNIPGVEMDPPEEEEESETLYSPGAEGRPVAGFQLQELMLLIKETMNESEWYDISAGETAPTHNTGAVEAEPQELVQRIESAYQNLQDAFDELPDEIAQEMGRKIISDLETLMDSTEHPEDYRE